MIPKMIHYCWFGGSALSNRELKCIESWRIHFPDYQIIRWDESNFDIHCIPYVEQAYQMGRWAFVSDYVRFAVLYEYGGLYFDTDVEVVKPMQDIIDCGPFMGCEKDGTGVPWEKTNEKTQMGDALPANGLAVNPGLGLAANSGNSFYKLVLDDYANSVFVLPDGSPDLTTVVSRVTGILKDRGLQNIEGFQQVDGINIYPKEYFNPKDHLTGVVSMTENTRAIHHFGMSWLTDFERELHNARAALLRKGFSPAAALFLARIYALAKSRDFERLKAKVGRELIRSR